MAKVTLQGFIIVPESDLPAVQAELPSHIALTLAEPGCISFSVTQDPGNPHRFNVSEAFVDQKAFRSHQLRVSKSFWGKVSSNVERHYTIEGLNESA